MDRRHRHGTFNGTCGGFEQTADAFDQRGLSGAVFPGNAEDGTGSQLKRDARKYLDIAIGTFKLSYIKYDIRSHDGSSDGVDPEAVFVVSGNIAVGSHASEPAFDGCSGFGSPAA